MTSNVKSLTAFYNDKELGEFGFASIGDDVKISRKCSIYGAEKMHFGSNVRVDDFCILSGTISFGSHIHVAAYAGLFGGGGIVLKDFCNLSSRVSIYSVSDDFTGETLTNPTIPDQYKNVRQAVVTMGRHVVVGAGTVVLPGANIEDGCAVGALSLVTGKLEAWGIYAGIPARRIKARKKDMLILEARYLASISSESKY